MHDGVFDPLMSGWEDECAKTSGTATYVLALMEKMSRPKQLTMGKNEREEVGEGKSN